MTVLSEGAEWAETEGASVFKSPRAIRYRKGASTCIKMVCGGNGWLMLSLTTHTLTYYSQLLPSDPAARCLLVGPALPIKTKKEPSEGMN